MRAGRSAAELAARRKRQAGFTLIELIIATAIGVLVLGAMTSVVLTTVLAANTATGRIEASSQVRNFQFTVSDDVAFARPPVPSGCGTLDSPCTTQEMVLQGNRVPNVPLGVAAPYTVRYTWDSVQHTVFRCVSVRTCLPPFDLTPRREVSTNVTAYSWYVDTPAGARPSVVVNMTVTVAFYNTTYSESQTLRFDAQITAPPSP